MGHVFTVHIDHVIGAVWVDFLYFDRAQRHYDDPFKDMGFAVQVYTVSGLVLGHTHCFKLEHCLSRTYWIIDLIDTVIQLAIVVT